MLEYSYTKATSKFFSFVFYIFPTRTTYNCQIPSDFPYMSEESLDTLDKQMFNVLVRMIQWINNFKLRLSLNF